MKARWKAAAGFVAVVAIAAAAGLYYAYGPAMQNLHAKAEEPDRAKASSERRIPVVLTPVARREFEERAVVQGNIEARNFATVSARVPGIVEEIFVDEGDAVVAGETKLFQIDALKLKKALEISRHDLAVARCGLREKQANLERVEVDMHKAGIDVRRFEQLHEDEAVSIDALEQQQSRYKQTKAVLKHAHSLVDLGQEQVRQAEAALAIAEKDLSDSLVYAPITGRVNVRFVESGEMCGVADSVVRIEDPSVLEVSAFLAAQYYPRVIPGETPVRVNVYGIDAGEHRVSYKSPTIDPKLRTFEIKCVLSDPPEGVVPGAMAELRVMLVRREALGVPAEALQQRGKCSVVFGLEDDLASVIEVETGLETDGWVEIRAGQLSEGTPVVTMGQFLLDEGALVTVREGRE